ncbi:flagellin N-terminal helical domain-containing protein, partial [Tissierella creatinophila]|uniref:flagellin N-terminal helical domain-containing protein n=1 Tax=Tissierella creatinophila TaxID=79681 RepID=UPI0022B8C599
MRINQNISAMNTYSRLTNANNKKAGSLAKLSSGLRINKAGDDAAGLAISEKMRGQIGGLKQATRNAQDGISLIQTAEGGLNETHSILNRMRELAVQSSSDTNTPEDRNNIQKEIEQLKSEIDRIGNTTQFNTKGLIDGSLGSKKIAGTDNAAVIGSAVGKETAANVTGAAVTFGTTALDNLTSNTNTIYVDGAKIEFTIDDNRKNEYKSAAADGKEVAKLMQEDINNAIDKYNAKNETNIAKVGVSVSSDNKISITSGSKGDTSTIKLDKAGATNDLFDITKVAVNTGTEGVFTAAGAASAAAIKNGTTASFVQGNHTVTIDLGAENAEYAKDIKIVVASGTEGAEFNSAGDELTLTFASGDTTTAGLMENAIKG